MISAGMTWIDLNWIGFSCEFVSILCNDGGKKACVMAPGEWNDEYPYRLCADCDEQLGDAEW